MSSQNISVEAGGENKDHPILCPSLAEYVLWYVYYLQLNYVKTGYRCIAGDQSAI